MKEGDKVRLLRGNEEGYITHFIDRDLVEVEIEDGFRIPVLKKEVVVIAKEEAVHFNKPSENFQQEIIAPKKDISQKGVYLAFVEINDKVLSLHLINNSSFELPYLVGEEGILFKGISSGLLPAGSSVKLMERFINEFDSWPALIFQFLFFRKGNFDLKEPWVKRMAFKASTFYRSKRVAPVMNKNAFLFQLDLESKSIDAQALKDQMMGNTTKEHQIKDLVFEKPSPEIDLHIEKLVKDFKHLSNSQILDIQLKTFESFLDKAIGSGMSEITFIHGAGNGTLKNAIHKRLSSMKGIKFYKEAQKEKFGYGATHVEIQ